jgi:hypothetical protein
MNMKSHLNSQQGKYQFDTIVGCRNPKTGDKTKQHVTVFADEREDAVRAACNVAAAYGYKNCTINHITQVR